MKPEALADLGVELQRGRIRIAPGWSLTTLPLSARGAVYGSPAFPIAVVYGDSVVCAGTGRQTMTGRACGDQSTVWGVETGTLNPAIRETPRGGSGFCTVETRDGITVPRLVSVTSKGAFTTAGQAYS